MVKKFFLGLWFLGLVIILAGCSKEDVVSNKLVFVTSADYPPFEYRVKGKITGFDVELGEMIAAELGKEIEFQDMQFSSLLAAVQSGMADAAISTITITEDRKKNFDFSDPYYVENMVVVFLKDKPIKNAAELSGKKIACQLGTTMQIWLQNHAPDTNIITTDNNPQAIEALKAGHVDGVLIDAAQGKAFSKKNKNLFYAIIAQADTGYAVAVKKGSDLRESINQALKSLEKKGVLKKLKKKYLEGGE